MKKTIFIIVFMFVVNTFPGVYVAKATNGDYLKFYGFEDYSAGVGEKVYPDENWRPVADDKSNWGSDGNGAVKIGAGGEANIYFGETFTEGSMHISFDINFNESSNLRVLAGLYNARNGNDSSVINTSYYSKAIMFNNEYNNDIVYYCDGSKTGSDMYSWNRNTSDIPLDMSGTHRVDLCFGDISSKNTAIAKFYIDGMLINDNEVFFSKDLGFKTFFLRVEQNKATDQYITIDNVYIHHITNNENLNVIINENGSVSLEDGVINTIFSERINAADITPEDFDIYSADNRDKKISAEIVDYTDTSVKIHLLETIDAGKYYLIFKDNIRGIIYDSIMTEPYEFKTDYEYKTVKTNVYLDENFNDYTLSDGTPPQGWQSLARLASTNVYSVEGTGGPKDYAMQISGQNAHKRFIKEFSEYVQPGEPYTVEFDLYYNNTAWYMYLAEPQDLTLVPGINTGTGVQTKDMYNANIALGMSGENTSLDTDCYSPAPIMGYGAQRCYFELTKFIDVKLSSEDDGYYMTDAKKMEWHRIKLDVKPINNSETEYIVSADGGKEYHSIVNREFMTNMTAGIGFATASSSQGLQDLRIDNINIYSEKEIPYPEVTDIEYVRFDGIKQKIQNNISCATSNINIKFNTAISENNLSDNFYIENRGERVPCEATLSDEGTTVNLIPHELFAPSSTYKLYISDNICSVSDDSIASKGDYTEYFVTLNDTGCTLYDTINIENNKASYNVTAVKTDNSSKKYLLIIAGYKTELRNVDGEDIVFDNMINSVYTTINISEDEHGIIELGKDEMLDLTDDMKYVTAYLWEYPALGTVCKKELELN